jgi:hypothetical protein
MTSSDRPGQPSEDAQEPSEDTHQQPPGRFSVLRSKSGWLWIGGLSVIALASVSAASISVATSGPAWYLSSTASGLRQSRS